MRRDRSRREESARRGFPWRKAVRALISVAVAAYWSVYMAALPGLSFWKSAVLIQTNSAMASVLPAGGAFAVGITYEMLGS